MGDTMKLLNLITVFLSVIAVELFSMYGDREGVILPEHAEEIRREEENRRRQEMNRQLREQREHARQLEKVRRRPEPQLRQDEIRRARRRLFDNEQ
jgi:hypothetical protein